MIKKRIVAFLVALLMVYGFANYSLAVPLSGQYTIVASATAIDADSWIFEYFITNLDQGNAGASYLQGLGGFYLMIPEDAIISNVSNPPAYVPMWGVYWDNYIDLSSPLNGNFRDPSYPIYWNDETELKPDSYWLGWWGNGMPSVYPIGSTASFSFRADGVVPGLNTGVVVTFWGPGQYLGYSTEILSPLWASVPEPTTGLLLGMGLAGVMLYRHLKLINLSPFGEMIKFRWSPK